MSGEEFPPGEKALKQAWLQKRCRIAQNIMGNPRRRQTLVGPPKAKE